MQVTSAKEDADSAGFTRRTSRKGAKSAKEKRKDLLSFFALFAPLREVLV
jgi:hypothetical protein